MPDPMQIALGTTGGNLSVERLEDGSYQANGSALTNGTVVTAENGNMYTVMIADDGMFSAEYVVPPALSIPLGTSGSAVDVVRNEDGTFSVMADGEHMVITAETMVTAANGNVYRAILSPEGIPVGVDHVAAMQDVMLGDHGGTIMLTQAEDKSWWYGEMAVADGYVHTAANGNMYALTMDAEGMWSAMYQQVEVMVALGTQGSVTLERAENMSWWLGSEEVMVGSEVMSESGNTYTLWYTDGAWSTRFEPESMMIEGTGLVAMTKEDRSGYYVDGEDLPGTLPALGTDIDTSMGTYRVTMMDGDLMGVRLDPVAIPGQTRFRTTAGLSAFPAILGDEDDTEDVNEGLTALVVGGEKHPFSALLGSGMSEKQGANYVAKAHEELVEIRARIEAVLDVFESAQEKQDQVDMLWGTTSARRTNVKTTLQTVFGDIGGLTDAPEFKDALSDIDDLIMALSSVDSLAAALEDDGVLGKLEVDAKGRTAEFIFDATKSESSVSYGVLGATRYGAISKKTRDNAVSKPDYGGDGDELGAFAFGVTGQTVRSSLVSSSGNAFYEGGTLAVDQDGTHYSGDISLRVKFSTNKVDGLISNLRSPDGDPWRYLFADVSSITLPQKNLSRTAQFTNITGKNMANVSYALRAGSSGTQDSIASQWTGRLLTDEEAGDHAVGQWSVGAYGSFSYLAGGFGAGRVSDEPDNRPSVDDGTNVKAKLRTTIGDEGPTYAIGATDATTNGRGSITAKGKTDLGGGNLTVTVGKFGWQRDGTLDEGHDWEQVVDVSATDDDESTREFKIDLATLVGKAGGAAFNMAVGPTHVSEAKRLIEAERNKLAVLVETDQLGGEGQAQQMIWQKVQEILLTRVFNADYDPTATNNDGNSASHLPLQTDNTFGNRLPEKVYRAADDFDSDKVLGWIDDILWALDSASNLESALDKDENGLFVQYVTDDGKELTFVNDAAADIYKQQEIQVRGTFGMTDFTRFGVWRVRRYRNAIRSTGGDRTANGGGNQWVNGELDTFAYSPLDATTVRSRAAANFPAGGEATFEGSTVAYVGRFDQNAGLAAFQGDVAVNVKWDGTGQTGDDELILGSLTAVISNFEKADTGDRLLHGDTREVVRELIFSTTDGEGIPITTIGEDNRVVFDLERARLSVGYANRNVATMNVNDGIAIDGAFVGNSSDGPLGVLGRYSIAEGSAMTYEHAPEAAHGGSDPAKTAIRDAYRDVSIHGAFGADLP